MFGKVLFGVMVLDLVACYIYCSIRKARQEKKVAGNASDLQVGAKNPAQSKSGLKQVIGLIYKWYRHLMDCVLRPSLFIVAYIPSHHIRDFLYKHIFKVDMHKKSVIYYGAELRAPWNIIIGEGSIIGDRVILDGRNGIRIGANVNISTGASIWTMQHEVDDPYFGTGGGYCECRRPRLGQLQHYNSPWSNSQRGQRNRRRRSCDKGYGGLFDKRRFA